MGVGLLVSLCGCGDGATPGSHGAAMAEGGATGGAGKGSAGSTASGAASGGAGGTIPGGGGDYVVPNEERCAPGGEVMAVDVTPPRLAIDESHLYLLSSLDSASSGSSLELSRVPLSKGPRETLVTQALYGFGFGVREGLVVWGARTQLIVPTDEDYADWDVWTLATSGGEPSRLVQGGVMKLDVSPAGVVVSRFEPGRLELHTSAGMTPLCPAFGVSTLVSNAEVVAWNTFRAISVCPLEGGAAVAVELNGDTDPSGLVIDDEHAYWRLGDAPGVWRAPLSGGAAELAFPDLDASLSAIVGQRAYASAGGGTRIDVIDLSSGSVDTLTATAGIAGLTLDATHAYWVDSKDQWFCVKRVALE